MSNLTPIWNQKYGLILSLLFFEYMYTSVQLLVIGHRNCYDDVNSCFEDDL